MNGKHLSICSDLSSAPITNSAVGNIKMLTGGDTKFCEKKQAAMVRMEKTTPLRLRRYGMGVEFTGEAEAQKQYHEYFHR